jgi:putative transposase
MGFTPRSSPHNLELPETDTDFSLRWSLIKQQVTRQCSQTSGTVTPPRSRRKRGEGTIWQRRFWEHLIRNDEDLRRHVDYIHFNPVKHGYVERPAEWPYSTFHKYVRDGMYPADWAAGNDEGSHSHGE